MRGSVALEARHGTGGDREPERGGVMGESRRKANRNQGTSRWRHVGRRGGSTERGAGRSSGALTKPPLSGLGGWLWLVQLGLALQLAVFAAQLAGLIRYLFADGGWPAIIDSQAPDYHPLMAPLAVYELAELAVLLLATAMMLAGFYRRLQAFPAWIALYLLACLGAVALECVFILLMPSTRESVLQNSLPALLRTAVLAAAWIPYFRRSLRVRNTFVH